MLKLLTSSEIDARVESLPGSVLSQIQDDVSWNHRKIMLPGFEKKGIMWQDTSYKSLEEVNEYQRNNRLPGYKNWRELESYLQGKNLNLDNIFNLLGLKRDVEYIISGKGFLGGRVLGALYVRDSIFPNIGEKVGFEGRGNKNLRLLGE